MATMPDPLVINVEYALQEVQTCNPWPIFDIPAPPVREPVGTPFAKIEGDHCFHMTFDPAGYRYEGFFMPLSDSGNEQMRYVNRDARFIDKCCRPDCGEEIVR